MEQSTKKLSVFSHQLLPSLFFRQPQAFIQSFELNGNEYANYLWKNLDGYSTDFENNQQLEINCLTHKNHKSVISLIEFSSPKNKHECFGIAFAYQEVNAIDKGFNRVFTAEFLPNRAPSIILFEWDQAIHREIKAIKSYDRDIFLLEIESLIYSPSK